MLTDGLRPLSAVIPAETLRSQPIGARSALNALAVGGAGAVVGLGLGSAQWLVLRRHVRSAGWWILANSLGWLAGLSLGSGITDSVGIPGNLLVVRVVSGAATGGMLSYLLGGSGQSRRFTAT